MTKEKNTRPARSFPQDQASYVALLELFHPQKCEETAESIRNAFEVYCFFTDPSMYNPETAFFLYQLMNVQQEMVSIPCDTMDE